MTAEGLCAMHGGLTDAKAIGRRGGQARTRPGMGGKQLPATLRERLDVAKLVLSELHANSRATATACTCTSNPGAWCPASEPRGYASKGGAPAGLADVVSVAVQTGLVTVADGAIKVNGETVERIDAGVRPPAKNPSASAPGYLP